MPGASSLNHSRVRETILPKNAVSETVSSALGTAFGSVLSFFVRVFLCLVTLFLFRFMSRFCFALLESYSSVSDSLLTLEDAGFCAPFCFDFDACAVSFLFFAFFDAGAGAGAGSVASLLSSRASGF